eukprot:jgi/Mesvir1/18706/Mv12419-RA.1
MMQSRKAIGFLARAASMMRDGSRLASVPVFSRGYADDSNLKKTVLYDFHTSLGAKMVPFAGWSMPIQYKDSIVESVLHCRSKAVVFDVSHMCGLQLKGKDAIKYIESIVVGDIAGLKNGTGSLSVMTTNDGGIIDDLVITKLSDTELYMVINAGCRDKDLAHMQKVMDSFKGDVKMHTYDDRALLALQGPEAQKALQALVKSDLSKLYFGMFEKMPIAGAPDCFVTRTGYTGEDGFEISIPAASAVKVTQALLEGKGGADVRMAGLGARDSLRLEAGLCLYGNDIDLTTSPVEAGLAWTIGKRRRAEANFPGASVILKQIAEGVTRKRVGLIPEGAPARQGADILSPVTGKKIGTVTSGGVSPCLKHNIAMGYVETASSKSDTKVNVSVRGKVSPAVVAKMPFVPAKYHRPT